MKKAVICLFIAVAVVSLSAVIVMAAEEPVSSGVTSGSAKGMLAIASGLAITIAAAAGAIGQGRIMSSTIEGIARNPGAQQKLFIPMILGLVFIESLVIYSPVIAFFLQAKI